MTAIRYGQFVERDGVAGRAFRITDPRTPMPWVNVVCNGRYGLVVSQNGGGFSWLDNSQLNVLTRWEMDLSRDVRGGILLPQRSRLGRRVVGWPGPVLPGVHVLLRPRPGSTDLPTEYSGIRGNGAGGRAADGPRRGLDGRTGPTRPGRAAAAGRVVLRVVLRRGRRTRSASSTGCSSRRGTTPGGTRSSRPRTCGMCRRGRGRALEPSMAVRRGATRCAGRSTITWRIGDKRAFLGRYGDPAGPGGDDRIARRRRRFGRYGDASAAPGRRPAPGPGQTVRLLRTSRPIAESEGGGGPGQVRDAPDAAASAVRRRRHAWKNRLSPTRIRTERPDFDL